MPKLLRNLKAKMDQMGRAMKGPTADMAGRAMVAPPNRMNRPAEPGMGYKKGGEIKDSKKMVKKEMSEMADKAGRAMKNRTADKMGRAMVKNKKMAGGGMAYSDGGSVYRKGADGVAHKGKTKGKMVKMRYGGECQ
jgi:hypothetical protein